MKKLKGIIKILTEVFTVEKLVRKFIKDESGMETIEWAMVGALVVLGFVTIWGAFGPKIAVVFTQMGSELDAAVAP